MNFLKRIQKSKWTSAFLKSIIALSITTILFQVNLSTIDAFFYDNLIKTTPKQKLSNNYTLVAIDSQTQAKLNRVPDAKDHKKLLQQLVKYKPKAILYSIDPVDIIGSYEELEALAKVMVSSGAIVMDEENLPVKGREEDLILLPPLQYVKVVSAPKTEDVNSFAKDKVTRRFVYSFSGKKLLHAQIGEELASRTKTKRLFKLKRTDQGYINYHPSQSFPKVSFLNVLNQNVNKSDFENKIIILGEDTKSSLSNYTKTPLSKDFLAMPNMELHANIIETIYQDNVISETPTSLNRGLAFIVALLTVFIVLSLRPGKGLMIIISTGFGILVLSYFMLWLFNFWLPIAQPLLTIFICYYFFIPYRLILENRRSWEYYEKNNLLMQVEELKSNFLKMMSHDLKTPLARIQGMTETILRNPKNLQQDQIIAVNSIKSSSEELTEFVGSILNLNRIESKEVKLDLKSKDINLLLEKIINKCQYLAQQKNIEIIAEFEPIFSLKIDESLLNQVFTNLIENAVKYSPENTKVLITTEEVDGKIIIQVADQGIGIPFEEQEKVFSKFYRSKIAAKSSTKGSGLGLYLSSYFVELHGGKIKVESETNIGSTFSIELPMQ